MLDRWKSINEPEIYIICLNPFINVSNFINCTWKPPLSSVERDWESMNAKQRQGAQQNVAELCRSVVSPPCTWLNVQKRRQSWLHRHQSWLGISKTAWRRSTTVVERRWRQPVACSRNSTARPICAALDGDSRRCQYAYLQLSTIDDARPRSMTDRYFTGARRRKFWTFQNFRTATAALAPSGARRHSPTVVSALCGAQLPSFTVFEPPLSADKNRQCVIVA